MTTENEGATGEEDRRARARTLVLEAGTATDPEEAERLLDEAARIDPQATEEALAEATRQPALEPAGTDEEVHRITATVEPHSAAPSRAGITGSGSGADDM